MLESCAATFKEVDGAWFTSHVNENLAEVAEVVAAVRRRLTTSTPTTGTGWSARSSVLAHNVHPTDEELAAARQPRSASVAHCPTSNSALGSGLFPLRRHLEHGVRVAMGSDVGAGTGLLDAQGGAAGLLHAAAARRRGAAPDLGAPALARDRRGRRRARPGRRGRRPVGGQAVRRDLGAARSPATRSTSACCNAQVGRRRAGQGLRARHDVRHRRRLGRRRPDRRRPLADPPPLS